MVRRTPFPDVLLFLKGTGYRTSITEAEYKGVIHPFPGFCPKNHECNISVPELKKGKGCCKTCGNESRNAKLRENNAISYEEVLNAAALHGYKILTEKKDYKGRDSKVNALCPRGHYCEVIVLRLVKGENCCRTCGSEITASKLATPFSEILTLLNETGYTLFITEKEYKGAKHSYPGLCPKKHNCYISPVDLKRGKRFCKICGLERYKQTCLASYGVEFPMQNKEIYQRYQESCLKNLGVVHPMQNPEVFQKWQESCFSVKKYVLPSGTLINFQGYENFCFDDLLFVQGYAENEFLNSYIDGEKMPVIWYNILENRHRYFPDIFIPKENRIIEIKSRYTFQYNKEINLLKLQACLDTGYNAEIRIYNEKGDIEEIITET